MSRRYQAGFIFPGYDPLEVPDAPTIGTATGGDEELSVAFTAPADTGGGAITAYNAIAITGGANVATGTNTASPVTVTGLTNGTAYTAKVWALNSYGPSPLSAASGSVTPNTPYGVFASGRTPDRNTIDYVLITTTGNAVDWGDLSVPTESFAAGAGNATRGVFYPKDAGDYEYITFASQGNSVYFGDLFGVGSGGAGGLANGTRGVFAGGGDTNNTIEYITINTTGNALDFGDLISNKGSQICGASSPSRGLFFGGGYSPIVNVIQYITIASLGNSTDFGDLTSIKTAMAATSSSTRAVTGGGTSNGGDYLNNMDYVTIASTGNATDFGDLTVARFSLAGASSNIRAVYAGGSVPNDPYQTNVVDYITIASAGNATDFGDLTIARFNLAGCSNVHGGLQ